ncbi:hypothetical protein GH714_005347 [Hevea brasiliensis]|uniref:EF-hand domain-containing protein n=1 Tax=Hevea brasiliensis TaxID=3981 RepID=A0A6A6M847_HEVBR|nr:hypothetical protein GH714_005347 [Hevea brasiliensis]
MPLVINECKQASTVLLEDQLRGLLKRYDANNDGKLSKAELKVAFKSLGSHFAGWRAMRAIHHADANGDGCISEDEMEELIKYAIKLGFQMDGLLSRQELIKAFNHLGSRLPGWRAQRALHHADRNGDGYINEES